MTALAASFLAAAVRPASRIVVTGAQGAGKTTLVRALCAEIPTHEAIGTFETEYELHLHELRERHPIVFAWEARPGSGERGPDGHQAGRVHPVEALFDSLPVQPLPPDRRRGPRPRGPRRCSRRWSPAPGRSPPPTPRTPRARSASSSPARWRPARTSPTTTRCARSPPRIDSWSTSTSSTDPAARRHPAAAPVGRADHHRHPRGAGEGVRRSSTCSAPTRAQREATAHVLDDSYRDLARYGFDLDGFYATRPGGRVMTPCSPPLAGALIVAGLIGLAVGLRPVPADGRPHRRAPARRWRRLTAGVAADPDRCCSPGSPSGCWSRR